MFSLNLFRSCMMSNSSIFYSYLYHVRNRKYVGKTLIGRVMEFCTAENIDIMKYMYAINDDYMKRVKHDLSKPVQDGVNGIIDSLRYFFRSYTPYNHNMTQCLLKSF